MPRLTREWVDAAAPNHGRTSCSDENLSNGYYTLKEETVRGVVVKRDFDVHPRCNRCFLLERLREQENGITMDPNVEIEVGVTLKVRQPNFEIKQL